MLIANRLRDHNRAEYLLYMWQVEDILRANGCDLDRLRENYLCQFQLTGDARQELEQWYADLCEMMRSEDKMQSGHLQINLNVVETLAELHEALIRSDKFPYYRQLYYKVLPFIVELRAKNGTQTHTGIREELNLCFELLLRRDDAPPAKKRNQHAHAPSRRRSIEISRSTFRLLESPKSRAA